MAKYADLVWSQHQSGGFEAQSTRMIHSGNRYLNYYLCEAALPLVRCDAEYRSFYHCKYKEVNKYQHKRALALTARKFVWLAFRLLKDNCLYRASESRWIWIPTVKSRPTKKVENSGAWRGVPIFKENLQKSIVF